jgi:putative tricarboxylic transport membrane protein
MGMIRSAKDFWAGLVYIFFGSIALLIARDYAMGTALKMGPAYFPTLLSGILILIGAISMIRSFVVAGAPIGALAIKALSLIVASVLLFGVLVKGLGLALSLPILVLMSGMATIQFRWWPTLVLATGLTAFCIVVFLKGLGVPLPIWGAWLGG